MKFSLLMGFALMVSTGAQAALEQDVFVNPDFRLRDKELVMTNPNTVAKYNIEGPFNSFESKKDPYRGGYFFEGVRRDLKTSQVDRTIEFYRLSEKNLKSSTAKFRNGAVESFTSCNSFVGCVTVNRALCDEMAKKFHHAGQGLVKMTPKKFKECGDVFKSLFEMKTFKSKAYREYAEGEYEILLEQYKKKFPHNIHQSEVMAKVTRQISLWHDEDPGKVKPHELKGVRAEDYTKMAEANIGIVSGIMEMYSACSQKGHLFGADSPVIEDAAVPVAKPGRAKSAN